MACSKIFSGDLPELTYEVIKQFKNDFTTLYSCVLVNRLWCRLAIPLLWENPFLIPKKNYIRNFNPIRNYNFIKIYLYDLNNNDLKTNLNEYKINNNSTPSKSLFNYPSFLKYLNTFKMASFVESWVEDVIKTSKPENRYFLQDLSVKSVREIKRLVNVSLFTLFIENEANLYNLEIEISNIHHNTCFINILELILQNTNFIHNIRNLKLFIDNTPHHNINEYTTIKDYVFQIINLHQNLKKILLGVNSLPLYQSLLLSEESNCLNTLNSIIFYYVNFNGIINLDKAFEQLNVLESVHIIYCSLNSSFAQQICNMKKPFKLRSLCIGSEVTHIDSFRLLLQKSGDYLENLVYGFASTKLLEFIVRYCVNAKHLCLHGIEICLASLIFNLIENTKLYLNRITLSGGYQTVDEFSSNVLQNLGQALPSKLDYLNLALHIKASDFEIFLENSQNTFIKRLIIMQNGSDEILRYIKEYIMKKRRVKHLAIKNGCIERKYDDLFNLKDEVKEFKLHDIRVRSYSELSVSVYDFIMLIKNID